MADSLNLDEIIGKKPYIEYVAQKRVNVFGTQFEIQSISGIVNAVVNRYNVEDDQVTLYFNNSKQGNEAYLATMDFIDE